MPTVMWEAPDIVPSITYADLPKAVEWLERVFGFRERVEARLSWPGGGMTWMEVGNALLNISTRIEGRDPYFVFTSLRTPDVFEVAGTDGDLQVRSVWCGGR